MNSTSKGFEMRIKRPVFNGSIVSTPMVGVLTSLSPSPIRSGSVAFSYDEYKRLMGLYGYKEEEPTARPEPPQEPKLTGDWSKDRELKENYRKAKEFYDKWQDPVALLKAGMETSLVRNAEIDGLRMVAWLSKYTEPGEDPLKLLIQLARDAGLDVSVEDLEFAEGVDEG